MKEPERPLTDCETIQKELKKKGVRLKLLWEEYKDQNPANHYQCTQFREYYHRWAKSQSPSARFPQAGGEVMEVDYAGMTLPQINPETGEVKQVPIFVATLPASNYVYAEAQPSQEKCYWINGHVRAFTFFGGVTKILRPDNPKMGEKSPHYYEPETCAARPITTEEKEDDRYRTVRQAAQAAPARLPRRAERAASQPQVPGTVV